MRPKVTVTSAPVLPQTDSCWFYYWWSKRPMAKVQSMLRVIISGDCEIADIPSYYGNAREVRFANPGDATLALLAFEWLYPITKAQTAVPWPYGPAPAWHPDHVTHTPQIGKMGHASGYVGTNCYTGIILDFDEPDEVDTEVWPINQ